MDYINLTKKNKFIYLHLFIALIYCTYLLHLFIALIISFKTSKNKKCSKKLKYGFFT